MSIYYELTPLDTMFFRGAEPLEAGQLEGTVLFPPPVSVIYGALRTAVLKKNGIDFKDYKGKENSNIPAEIIKLIGNAECKEEDLPFKVTSFLLKKDNIIYTPAPYSWFVDSDRKLSNSESFIGHKVICAEQFDIDKQKSLSITSSVRIPVQSQQFKPLSLPVVKTKKDAVTLGGFWIRLDLLQSKELPELSKDSILAPGELYRTESRIGISLLDDYGHSTRNVRKSALFTAAHTRLNEGVTIVIGISGECGLDDSGLFTFGGEKRLCQYQKIDLSIPAGTPTSNRFVALSPVKAKEKLKEKLFCAGKLVITAGWDLAKGYHKSSESWFPAGSVFIENVNNQCVPLAR